MLLRKRIAELSRLLIAGVFPVFLCALSGCTPRMQMQISGTTDHVRITFSTGLTGTAEAVIKSMAGAESDELLFPAGEITRFLCAAGFTGVTVKEQGTAGFAATLSQRGGDAAVIPAEITATAHGGRVTVAVTPEHIRSVLALLPADISDYTELLMAPILTGETMTAAEFAELIGAAYGPNLAADLSASVFEVTLSLPGTPVSGMAQFSGGTYPARIKSGNAVFSIPAAVLFSETTGFTVTAEW